MLYHELSYLPIPLLRTRMLKAAPEDPALVRRCLAACRIAPGQQRTGRRVEAELVCKEMEQLLRGGNFPRLAHMEGEWLPSGDAIPPVAALGKEAGKFLAAAAVSANPYAGLKQLATLRNRLKTENLPQPRKEDVEWHVHLPQLVNAITAAIARVEPELQERAKEFLPNPFQPNRALEPGEGTEIFRGREDAVRTVERLVADPSGGATLALLAPRRTGKSTLLSMLPEKMPDAVTVFCDVQHMPADTLADFLNHLDDRLTKAAKHLPGVNFPRLERPATIGRLGAWFQALESAAGERRILFCLDEFERLEGLWPGTEKELLQFMSLLRATIQNHRRVRLLVSGAAPFDELGPLWRDHFINTRELRLGYFDETTTTALLRQPIPQFPPDAIPADLASAIYRRTGGQPYLVQLYGWLLVERLNEARRKTATMDDLEPVERVAVQEGNNYFGWLIRDCPPEPRRALLAILRGEHPQISPVALRTLERRGALSATGQLLIPAAARWLEENPIEGEWLEPESDERI